MQVLYPAVVACMLLTDPDGTIRRIVRTFGTMTADLLALGDWLSLHEVTHVAMESTGVLWRPVFNVLEEGRTFLLVNAEPHQSSTGPQNGREGQRMAGRRGSRHGLLRPSFIPPPSIRVLRDLTRYRKHLVELRTEGTGRVRPAGPGRAGQRTAPRKAAHVASGSGWAGPSSSPTAHWRTA